MASHYSVFGLRLESNLPIPGLLADGTLPSADVQACLGTMPPWMAEGSHLPPSPVYLSPFLDDDGGPILTVQKLERGEYFRFIYSDGTEFVVDRRGSRIWATWRAPWTVEDMATYLLGPVLGFVLRQRGVPSLHASGLVVGNRVIGLLGPAGSGKSTVAAAFARRGFPVITDDILAFTEEGDRFWVQPAYPRLRLWPDSVAVLFGSPDRLPPLTPNWDKRYLDLTQPGYRFQSEALPLAAMYLLAEGSPTSHAPHVEIPLAATVLMKLIANTYSNYASDASQLSKEFMLFGRVVERVPVRTIVSQRDFASLSKLCDIILEEFQVLAGTCIGQAAHV